MQLYSLFFAESINDDEGTGCAVYHGTFSTADLARVEACRQMQTAIRDARADVSDDAEALLGVLNDENLQLPIDPNWDRTQLRVSP